MTDTIPVSNEIMLRTAFWKTQSVHIAFLFLQAQSIHIVRFEKRNEFTLRFLKGTMWRLCFKKKPECERIAFFKTAELGLLFISRLALRSFHFHGSLSL